MTPPDFPSRPYVYPSYAWLAKHLYEANMAYFFLDGRPEDSGSLWDTLELDAQDRWCYIAREAEQQIIRRLRAVLLHLDTGHPFSKEPSDE